jgi:hypothetical protein
MEWREMIVEMKRHTATHTNGERDDDTKMNGSVREQHVGM